MAVRKAKKGAQLTLLDVPEGADKIGPLMPVVLRCVNEAAGTAYPFTAPKVRWLKAIVKGTPEGSRNEEWWSGFFGWLYRAQFHGRKTETSWTVDTLARNLDKYIDLYCNRDRFACTRYSQEQEARDEWELVIEESRRRSNVGAFKPTWGPRTATALKAVGGLSAIRFMREADEGRMRAAFVREWVIAGRNATRVDGMRASG